MRTDIPSSVTTTQHDLSVDALVTLFVVTLRDLTEFRLTSYNEVVWQGDTYERAPCQMTDLTFTSDGKVSRPRFSVVNPEAMFSSSVHGGLMDGATVTRLRILRSDLEANNNFSIQEQFKVHKVVALTKDLLVTELRDVLDGPHFKLPGRAFYPPEFPHVKLQ